MSCAKAGYGMAVAVAMLATGSVNGAVVNLLSADQSGVESSTINVSPRTSQGTDPTGWTIVNGTVGTGDFSGELASPLVDLSVEAVGSPFGGGSSNSMLLFDASGTGGLNDGDYQLKFQSTGNFTQDANNTGSALYFAFDFRVNTVAGASDYVHFRPYFWNNSNVVLVSIDSQGGRIATSNASNVLGTNLFAKDAWYRLEGVLETATTGSLKLTKWDTDTDSPVVVYDQTNLTLTPFSVFPETGVKNVVVHAAYSANGRVDVNVDNVVIGYVPEPAAVGLLGLSGATMLARRPKR